MTAPLSPLEESLGRLEQVLSKLAQNNRSLITRHVNYYTRIETQNAVEAYSTLIGLTFNECADLIAQARRDAAHCHQLLDIAQRVAALEKAVAHGQSST